MAVETRKSGVITNRDASVVNSGAIAAGMLRQFKGTVESVNADSIGSKYIFGSIPSNASVHSLRLYCDDVGTTAAADFGLYRTTGDGGAVVDADLFGSAVALSGGALNGTDILHESAVNDPDDAEKLVWQLLGLSADPCLTYDVVATLTAASDAAGTVTLIGAYSI